MTNVRLLKVHFILLKFQGSREIFGNKIFIIRAQYLPVRRCWILRIQVVRIEQVHPFEHLVIMCVHQVIICMLPVLSVKRMVSERI